MNDLYIRRYSLTIGEEGKEGREWSDLRVAFSGEHTPKRTANTITLRVYNLSRESRSFIKEKMKFILEAGYLNDIGMLFRGDITAVSSHKEGSEWVTDIECGDGIEAMKTATIQATIPKGATPEKILSAVKGSLGGLKIGEGFVDSLKAITTKVQGVVLSGSSANELDSLFERNGYTWSIQDEEIQALKEGSATPREAVYLDSSTGLVGSPKSLEGGKLEVTALLIHQARPGRALDLNSNEYKGAYVILKHKFSGDTHSGQWLSVMEVKPL